MGLALFDFQEQALTLDLKSSFFYAEDIFSILKNKISWPQIFRHWYAASFFMRYNFKDPLKHEIKCEGKFIQCSYPKRIFLPMFPLISPLKKEKVKVHFIKFEKNTGEIHVSGTFDSRFHINLDITGSRIALERLQSLNSFIPFNQSGTAEIKVKVEGSIFSPRLHGEVNLSETALYTYPVKASKLKISLDKKGLLLSGRIMEEIQLKRFYWPFDESKSFYVRGKFLKLGFY